MPSVVVTNAAEAADYAFAFAVPAATEGVKIISRPTVVPQNPGHQLDHPLSSRFDEGDATIVFDKVFVPWERTFIYRDVDRCNAIYKQTWLAEHYTHQTQTRALAKAEFMHGGAGLLHREIDQGRRLSNVQGQLAELLMFVEMQRALLAQAVETATETPFGTFAPNKWPLHTAQIFFYERYDRMINAVRALGAGGLVAAPSFAELGGPIGDTVEAYFASAGLDSERRIRLLRLAADASISSFSGRQALYERYYQGDPVRRAAGYYAEYPLAPLLQKIDALLDQPVPAGKAGKRAAA